MIDRTLYLALFNSRFLSVGLHAFAACAVYNARFPIKKRNQGIVFLEEASEGSKYSVLPMLVINSFDFSLNALHSSGLVQIFF